jgi:hypothetical protein
MKLIFYFSVFLFFQSLLSSDDKVEKVFDIAEKVNTMVGSSSPRFEKVTQVIGQGLEITKDLVSIFKKVPDPDLGLTVREKHVKDRVILERYIEKYSTAKGIQTLNLKDFKFHYDEVKNVFFRYGKNDSVLRKEWAPYRDNEASYIALTAINILQLIKEAIADIDNKADLLQFQSIVSGVTSRIYAKQVSLARALKMLDNSEKVTLDSSDEEFLFAQIGGKNSVFDKSIQYNSYNTLLDLQSFVGTKNDLCLILKKKLSRVVDDLVDLQIKNNSLTEKYFDQLENSKMNKGSNISIDLLKEVEKPEFYKKVKVANPQIAIPFYGAIRAMFDKDFRTEEKVRNSAKNNLFAMNKYIVYGK